MSTTQTVTIFNANVNIKLPDGDCVDLQDRIAFLAQTLDTFIKAKVNYGLFATCDELIPYLLPAESSMDNNEYCKHDSTYRDLRSSGKWQFHQVLYRSISRNSLGKMTIFDQYATIDNWRKYHLNSDDVLTLGDRVPIYKLLKLLILHINKTFNGELVIRMVELMHGYPQLFIFRPPMQPNKRCFADTPCLSCSEQSPDQQGCRIAEVSIKIFHRQINNVIQLQLQKINFDPSKIVAEEINLQDNFLGRLSRLFSGLRNGPKHILVSWGPKGIGDLSDYTVRPFEDICTGICYGGHSEDDLNIHVSTIYCVAYKFSREPSFSRFDYEYVRKELGVKEDVFDDDRVFELIRVCLLRRSLLAGK